MIVVVDPGMSTTNLGDHVISQAISTEFVEPLRAAGHDVELVPLHGSLDARQRALIDSAQDVVVSGTNLLSSHMRFRSPWQWTSSDKSLLRKKLTIFGAGWWQYQTSRVDALTGRWLRELTGNKPWALRDLYSTDRIVRAGVAAVHTTCPTLWRVENQNLGFGGKRVVATFTDYSQDRNSDGRLLALLRKKYDDVLLWPQGPGDAHYMRQSLDSDGLRMLEPNVQAFDSELLEPETDYVGLRLHAGIRAMQLGVPSLVLSIDNRASEIARSTKMVAPSRHDFVAINHVLDRQLPSFRQLDIPTTGITSWKAGWGID